MSTSFIVHLSKTKIDDFVKCMVCKFDTVYRKIPIYWKFLHIGMTETQEQFYKANSLLNRKAADPKPHVILTENAHQSY